MQHLLTEQELAQIRGSSPNFEKLITLMEGISTQPFADATKLQFFRDLSKDLMEATPETTESKLSVWEMLIFPQLK